MGKLRIRRMVGAVAVALVVSGCGSTSPSASITAPTASGAEPVPSGDAVVSEEPSVPASPPATSPAATPTSAATPSTGPSLPTPAPPTPAPTTALNRWANAGAYASAVVDDLTATQLGSGRVLFLGTSTDWDTGVASPFASVWDPNEGGTATPAPTLPKVRTQAVVVGLRDGRVLVAGGLNDASQQSYSSAYVFDEAGKGTWTKVGLMHLARSSACAAVLPDGRVLVAGGYFHVAPNYGSTETSATLAAFRAPAVGGFPGLSDVEPPNVGTAMATAELFDPATGAWSDTGPMHYARVGCAATTLADGRVLVAGSAGGQGVTVPEQALETAEVFDPSTGRFALTGHIPRPDRARYGDLHDLWPVGEAGHVPGELLPLPDGGALLVGDSTSLKHEGWMTRTIRWSASGAWSEIAPTFAYYGSPGATPLIATPGVRDLSEAMVVADSGGRVLAIGGYASSRGPGWGSFPMVGTAQAWSAPSGKWSSLPSLPAPRARGLAVELSDGTVIVAGGWSIVPGGDVQVTSILRLGPG
jgi:hypothetical protein